MSRIHEALKKAQEEHPDQPTAQDVGDSNAFESVARASAGSSLVLNPPSPSINLPLVKDDNLLSLETLLARCAPAKWKTDPSFLESLNGGDDVSSKEAFRTLRTRLYQIRASSPLRSLLITSALGGEGKTFLASHLAHSIIRQRERRVLLIDGDLRFSQLHERLGASPTPGLTDYLLGEVDEIAILQRGPEENLFLISGGKSVSNATELLGNGRLERLMSRLALTFDWILFDSPPAFLVSD